MPGHRIETNLGPKSVLSLAMDVAEELGFDAASKKGWEFRARKGNLPLSVFLGAIIAYCDFRVTVDEDDRDGTVELTLHRNSPWWTGWIGVNRVKSWAKELAKKIADAIEQEGGQVLSESSF